jgi:Flp pilus assembly pilin Flp
MLSLLKQMHQDESGQDIIEYIIVAAVITVGSIATIGTIGNHVSVMWNNLNTQIANVP